MYVDERGVCLVKYLALYKHGVACRRDCVHHSPHWGKWLEEYREMN